MSRTRILVVEDENIIAMEVEDRLKNLGYLVPAIVSTGPDAITAAAEIQPDLILMDIMLKGKMDGIEAARQIHHRFNIPIIYLTAYADENTLQRAKITQPFGYLIKPFEERDLHTAIEMALHKHQLEQQLRRSQASLAEAQRIAHLGNWDWNISTNELYWSDETYRIFGLTPQEFEATYEAFLSAVHPDDREFVEKSVEKALNKNKPYNIEHRIVKANGDVRVVHEQGEITFDEQNHPILMVGTVQDITERVQAEEEQRKLSNAVEQTADSIVITDREGKIEYVNPAFTQTSGYTLEEAWGKTPRILKSDRHEAGFYRELWDTVLAGRVFRTEFINRKKNGQLYYEEKTITPLKDNRGNITHLIATAKNITDRILLEQRLAAIYKLGQELTLLHDELTVIRRVLETATNILEFEIAGCGLVDEAAGELVYQYYQVGGSLKTSGTRFSLAGEQSIGVAVVRSGQALNLPDTGRDTRYVPIADIFRGRSELCVPMQVNKQVIGVLNIESVTPASFTSADEQLLQMLAAQAAVALENARLYEAEREQYRRLQQSQAQLVQVEKMAALGRLVASIAHEINNPLQAVQTSLTLVHEELEDEQRPEKLQHYLSIAGGEIDRIAAIIQRMRDFYRPTRHFDEKKGDLDDFYSSRKDELQAVALPDLLENVLLLTNKQLQHNRITVERAWDDDLPAIEANADHLKQVFLNLVLNAGDAMTPEGGMLRVSVELVLPPLPAVTGLEQEDEPVVRIKFSDTGPGIPPEASTRLFEPLFTTKEHGTGFGLYTSYKIIEAHHGQILVESEVGAGTTFTIFLPVQQP